MVTNSEKACVRDGKRSQQPSGVAGADQRHMPRHRCRGYRRGRDAKFSIQWTRPSGKAVLIGICSEAPRFNFNNIVGPEKRVIGSVSAAPHVMEAAVQLAVSGKLHLKQ